MAACRKAVGRLPVGPARPTCPGGRRRCAGRRRIPLRSRYTGSGTIGSAWPKFRSGAAGPAAAVSREPAPEDFTDALRRSCWPCASMPKANICPLWAISYGRAELLHRRNKRPRRVRADRDGRFWAGRVSGEVTARQELTGKEIPLSPAPSCSARWRSPWLSGSWPGCTRRCGRRGWRPPRRCGSCDRLRGVREQRRDGYGVPSVITPRPTIVA
jgi:hypothetical protein